MKKFLLTFMLVAFMVAPAFAFESNGYFNGFPDNEYTPAVVAGSRIVAGQWVVAAVGSTLTTANTLSGYRMDTMVVGIPSPVTTDNGASLILGLAMQSADTGQYCQLLTHGYGLAYIDASDTGGAALVAGEPLSLSPKAGSAGSALGVLGVAPSATQAAGTKIIGYTLYGIGVSQTPLLARIYVTVR